MANKKNKHANMPAPVTSDELSVSGSDGLPLVDDTKSAVADKPPVAEFDGTDDSMRGGYASVSDPRIASREFPAVGAGKSFKPASENKLLWTTVLIMTVLCIIVGVCSSLLTAHFMKSGERPPSVGVGDVQQNIAAVVSSRKNCVAEVSCGSLRGSGIVMKRDGSTVYVVTNAHVIKNYIELATAPAVRFYGEDNFYAARVVGYDLLYDVAVVSLARETLFTVYDLDGDDEVFAPDTAIAEGDYVVAIGNAMGYGVSVYDGIVSRKSELLECDGILDSKKKTVPVMRTTAAVNAGMSGGALFDMSGRLVGLNTYRMSNSVGVDTDGGANTDVEDTGFVVPVSILYPVYKRIMSEANGGEVSLATIRLQKTSTSAIGYVGLPFGFNCEYRNGKLTVASLDLASPNKNVKEDDIIEKIGDVEITDDICATVGALLCYNTRGAGKALTITTSRVGTFSVENYRYAI